MVLVATGGLAPLGDLFGFWRPWVRSREETFILFFAFSWYKVFVGCWDEGRVEKGRSCFVLCVLSGCLALSCDTCWKIDHVLCYLCCCRWSSSLGYGQILSIGDLTSSSSSSEF